ncbi:MAG: sporulation protein YunB [Oscillospiraceae bacterium]|nr:sporulation protein YunB [Oscillospiraceae bacterium]
MHRYRRKRRGKVRFWQRTWFFNLLSAALGISLALLLIWGVDARLRPVIADTAESKTRNVVTALVSEVVLDVMTERGWGYDDFVTIQTDTDGRVTLMTTDTVKLNTLRSDILTRVVAQVEDLDTGQLGIPFGTVTGFSPAGSWWPTLPVKVVAVASSSAAFENEFSEAGINQTLHRIVLNVEVTVKLLIPGGTVELEIPNSVCLTETLIVGQVPEAYLTPS